MNSSALAGRILAYVLSAALAFPAPVWAAGSDSGARCGGAGYGQPARRCR